MEEDYSLVSVNLSLLILTLYGLICSAIGVITTYINVQYQNYNWWWSSFFSGGGTGIWMFLINFLLALNMLESLKELLFFTLLNTCFSGVIFLMSGAISSAAAFFFLKNVYSSMRLN